MLILPGVRGQCAGGDSDEEHPQAEETKSDKGKDKAKEDASKGDAAAASDEKKTEKKPAPITKPETEGFDIVPAPRFEVAQSSPAAVAWRALRAAEIQLKFGVAEQGHVATFAKGRQILDGIPAGLGKVRPEKAADSETLTAAFTAAAELRGELTRLQDSAAKTLFGRFPLIRAFGIDLAEEEKFQIHSYATPGMAERRAVGNALTKIAESASSDPLYVVILVPGETESERTSGRLARLVDAEAPQAFDHTADARLYPGSLRAEWGPMPAWDATDPALDPLCRRFLKYVHPEKAPRSLMLVMVREFADEEHGQYWVQAQQRTYDLSALEKAEDDPEKLESDKVRMAESLTRDRSQFTPAIAGGALCLFLLALVIQAVLSFKLPHSRGWLNWLAIPSFGYLTGLILTPLIMLALKRGLPEPQSAALTSAWWPCVAGALSLILPAGVFRMGVGSAGRYFPAISCHGRWGVAFIAVALGICAAWIRPALYALGPQCIPFVVALGIAAALLVYCFGRAIDLADHFPLSILPVTLSLALVFGGGAFLGSPVILLLVAGAAGLTTALHTIITRRQAAMQNGEETQAGDHQNNGRQPRTIAQLRAALQAPLYQPPPEFEHLRRSIEQVSLTHSTWIGLVGQSAAGKTAAARHLIRELQSSHKELQVLVGHCAEGAPPYQPFREALADVGVSTRLMTTRSRGGDVNNIIERLADEFIPFWDFFSGAAEDDEEEEVARADLLAAVTNGLSRLAQEQQVVLFLDDIQWLDEGSAAVLKHLRERFAPGNETPLVIVLASRDHEAIARLELEGTVFSLRPPSAAQQIAILERSLGIETPSARRIVSALGVMSQEAGGMFWLMRAVQELANENAFVASNRGFALRAQYSQPCQMPVPIGMREKLSKALQASGEYLPVVECAALLGEKFRIDDLVECLGMDRMKLLQALRHLEDELQLVRDIPADDECYAFSSTFMLEIVREEMGVGKVNTTERAQPSKIAREWNARIAQMLERRTPRTPDTAYRIAQHYFAAGRTYASVSVDRCLEAAHVASKKQAFALARQFVEMAGQASRLAGRPVDVACERQRIDPHEAQVSQRARSNLSASHDERPTACNLL